VGLGDNTLAEMEAGRKNLQHYGDRNNAEHEAGRRALEQRTANPQGNFLAHGVLSANGDDSGLCRHAPNQGPYSAA
jgi:hypothetical protein